MEREIEFEVGNGMLMKQIEREAPTKKIKEELKMELANEVYIFTSPGMPGIKFYDRFNNYA